MAIKSITFQKNRGLVTNISPALSPGDLAQAWNVMIRRNGWIEQRRSYRQYNTGSPVAAGISILAAFPFHGVMYLVDGNGDLYKTTDKDTTVAWDPRGYGLSNTSADPLGGINTDPTKTYARTAYMDGNCYYTSKQQQWTIGNTLIPRISGIPTAPDPTQLITLTGTGAWLANNSGVAYRVVWGVKDDASNVIQGPPSGRAVLFNITGNTVFVELRIPIPIMIQADMAIRPYNYYIYRTTATAASTALASIPDPGDQMNLIYQASITGSVPANAEVVFDDQTPDGFVKGPDLYTNSGQGGAASAKYAPPNACDICEFRGSMFYAAPYSIALQQETLIGLPDPWPITAQSNVGSAVTLTLTGPDFTQEGFTIGSTCISVSGNSDAPINGDWLITAVTSTTIKFTVSGTPGGGGAGGNAMVGCVRVQFQQPLGGVTDAVWASASFTTESASTSVTAPVLYHVITTGSTAQNLALTSQSLVRALNKNTLFGAFLLAKAGDTAADPPGTVRFESIYSGRASATNNRNSIAYVRAGPSIILTGQGKTFGKTKWSQALFPTVTSPPQLHASRLMYSALNEPEAVPLANFFDIGDASRRIQRIIASRDSLFIFKEDGLWRLVGNPNLGFEPVRFDSNIILLGDNMVTTLHNKVYAVTSRGICEISDSSGVRWISGQIQDKLRLAADWASGGFMSFFGQHCIANERDGCVFFFMLFQSSVTDKSTKVFSMCYNAETETWTQTDATGPHQYPGFYNQNTDGGLQSSTIYRHYYSYVANGHGEELLAENVVDINDDPALNSVALGVCLPGDGYFIKATSDSVNGIGPVTVQNHWSQVPAIGDVIVQKISGVNYAWKITNVTGTYTVTISPLGNAPVNILATGSIYGTGGGWCLLLKGFASLVEWVAFDAGDTGSLKQWNGITVLMDSRSTADAYTISASSELSPTPVAQQVASRQLSARLFSPISMQRSRKLSVLFTHTQPGLYIVIDGIDYDFTPQLISRENE